MNLLKKTLIFLLIGVLFITVVGCDNLTTTFSTQETSDTTLVTTTNTIDITSDFTTTFEIITSETTNSPLNPYVGIEVIEITKTEYELFEEFDETSITVILKRENGDYVTVRTGTYLVSGFDSSSEGTIEVTIEFNGFYDTFTLTILPNDDINITLTYYESAQGLSGNQLLLELRSIINNGKVRVSYDDARYILDETDRDPNNPNNVILVYTRESVPGEWNYPAWNREHVWPQSLLGYDSVMTSDLHNLKPSDVDENGFRGNKYFDNISSSIAYEPHDDVKGDVARILFYMVVMYEGLELVNQTPSTYQMAMLSTLLEWHTLDPVDDFERNRNEVIYQYQKNRNPFIDYPEFVEMIWG